MVTAVFIRQCGNGGAGVKSGNHASQRMLSHSKLCNSPCPTKRVMAAGAAEAAPFLNKENRDAIRELLKEDAGPSTPKWAKGWVADELGSKVPVNDSYIKTLQKDFANGDTAWIPSVSSLKKIQRLQENGFEPKHMDALGDRLPQRWRGERAVNRAMNSTAIHLRLVGMESTGWQHPRFGSDDY